jgi:hypothetical protein
MASEKEHPGEPTGLQDKTHKAASEERKPLVRPSVESRAPQAGESAEGLAQLREILVGANVRELERRLARAESHMTARTNELEQESRRRMEVIEAHLRKESDALTTRLEHELSQTSGAIRTVTREQRESLAEVDQRVAKLEEAIVKAQRETRDQMLQQAKRFLDELQQLRREVMETLERELGHVDADFGQGGYGEEERASP